MAENIICKTAYNGVDKENWIENRDMNFYVPNGIISTYIHYEELERVGDSLAEKLEIKKDYEKPLPLVKLENIEY